MSDVPDDLKFTAEHEWVRTTEGSTTVRVGITDFAQEALGDVVYVSLPELGAQVAHGAAFGEVESTKSVSDIYAPLAGTITARNESLDGQPELINSDPYGEGWLVEITLVDDADVTSLLDGAAYRALTG
jgi:glycine cleavage system H protein